MSRYVVDVNNTSAPTDQQGATQGAEELRALKSKLAAAVAGAFIVTATGTNAADITTYIRPDVNDRPSMVAGGWLPWNLNQQWGGAGCMPFHMVDSATGVEYRFDAFDAYIDSDTFGGSVGNGAATIARWKNFTSQKAQGLQALWIKLGKTGNPVDNATVQLWTIVAGLPGALIATANVINGKQITSDPNGQWYRFSFAAVQNLAANTQYAIVATKSAGLDAANFYNWIFKASVGAKYPNNLSGDGTAVPVFAISTFVGNFICEAQASDQPIQTLGQFAGRLIGTEGNPINRSIGYCKPLREFFPLFDPTGWSIHIRGKSFTKDRTFFEAMYGLHHDRINVRSLAATGLTTVTIYKQDGTVVTLSGTTDISTNTFKDIMIVGRSMGDGGDYLRIYVGAGGAWTKEAELTLQTFTFDPLMLKQGTGWIMGGFQLFPLATYTNLADMTVLPSAAPGYTFTTTTGTVEGNVFAVSNGKLNQIKAGMAAGGDGFYSKLSGIVNANGGMTSAKLRIESNTNSKDQSAAVLRQGDGTRLSQLLLQEYYVAIFENTNNLGYPQLDFKSVDITAIITSKGNDHFAFINGRLVGDGTGQNTTVSAVNTIQFGDGANAANENADAVWDYVGYYNTSNIYPQFTSGELHEFAVFSGDKNLLGAAVYNLGVPLSLKQFCGIRTNYVGEFCINKLEFKGITSSYVDVTPNDVLVKELEGFILGEYITADTLVSSNNTAIANLQTVYIRMDGVNLGLEQATSNAPGAGYNIAQATKSVRRLSFGLHKIETRIGVNAGNQTQLGVQRRLSIEARNG